MSKITKHKILSMTPQEAMVLINELGLPEGTGEEMKETLFGYYGLKNEPED